LVVLPLSLFRLKNRVCLCHGVQVTGAAWHIATRIVVVVGDLVQRIRNGRTGRVLSGRVIKRSGETVCGLHRAREDEKRGFFSIKTKVYGLSVVWPQNHWDNFVRFDLKTGGNIFSRFGLKTGGSSFLV
jgi:hypothetical protein